MKTLYEVGFLGSGATIAARLLDFGPTSWLINVRSPIPGHVRWYDQQPSGALFLMSTLDLTGGPFPYGYEVEPP